MEIRTSTDDGVLTITLARPDRLNALTLDGMRELTAAVRSADAGSGVRVVVLAGEGRGFCAGADFGDRTSFDAEAAATLVDAANDAVRAIVSTPCPVVALARGPVAGVGVPIALACDLVVADDTTFFALAFGAMGLMPDGGSTALVAASVGRARAMRLALLGDRIAASEALAAGLVSHLLPASEFEAGAAEVVARLRRGSPAALARTKAAVNAGSLDASLGRLEGAFALEREGQVALLQSADFTEGVAAFRAKRAPEFG